MSVVAPDPSALLQTDLPCVGCGYNLRTLPVAGRCPECGGEVGRSTAALGRRWALARADRQWLAGLRDGVGLGAVAVLSAALARLVLEVFPQYHTQPYAAAAAAIVPWGLALAAVWFLTRRDAGDPRREPLTPPWPRRAIRVLAVAELIGLLALTDTESWQPSWRHLAGDFLTWLSIPISLLVWLRLRALARALDSRSLVRQTTLCAAGVPAVFTAMRLMAPDSWLVDRSWVLTTLTCRPQPLVGCPASVIPVELHSGGCIAADTADPITFLPAVALMALALVVMLRMWGLLTRIIRWNEDYADSPPGGSRP